MPLPDVPASLKAVKGYLEQANLLDKAQPIVAYHCRLHSLNIAMEQRQMGKLPKEDTGFLIAMMDVCEADKKDLGVMEDANAICENFAQELFTKADDADRAGQSTLPVAKQFLASSQLMEVCKQFGDLPPDLLEKIKYSKWRFVEICKATKERRPPAPPRGLETEEDSSPAVDLTPSAPLAPPVAPVAPYGADPAGGFLPPPPMGGGDAPPDYMALPPPPPPDALPPAQPASTLPAPPSYSALPPPPAAPPPGAYASSPVPPAMPMVQPLPGHQPTQIEMLEAHKMIQTAAKMLEFQDHHAAVVQLQQALVLLTQPAPAPPRPQ